ncbi:hypothetical protein LSG31_00325 [Fodinisporobacter ferrooxydans]|uniref:Uncharacterized protein n=1 Tax=Fodinisporobacter ferrooxydans TaxID=2901836 RepID=A0ABY4CJR5_9BACL|nr:hypothetical protein LSG31_00325 [Alicyclobacillaceae bacterium MYW30-H2]
MMDNPKGDRIKMTAVKPIRPTQIEFSSKEDLQKFYNYATSTTKSNSEELKKLRELRQKHVRARERK